MPAIGHQKLATARLIVGEGSFFLAPLGTTGVRLGANTPWTIKRVAMFCCYVAVEFKWLQANESKRPTCRKA